MIELSFHNVHWCAQHGHPALALQVVGSNQCLVIALGTDDALALAAVQAPGPAGPGRTFALFEAGIHECGGRLCALQLHVGPDAMVRAFLHLDGPRGATLLPAHIADGLALALRASLPLWMADEDLARFGDLTARPTSPANPPEPFRQLVESLDLDGFGAPGV